MAQLPRPGVEAIGCLFPGSWRVLVEAECAGPECRDLEEPARDHHVLEEVDHLVLVREVVVERNRCREREDGQGYGDEAHTIACDQKQATAELGRDSDSEGKRRKR